LNDSEDDSNGPVETQNNQRKTRAAENDPEITRMAENLRREAAEMVNENNDDNDLV
jgi:hypothetical protein